MSSVGGAGRPGSRAHHKAPARPEGHGYTSPMNSRATDEFARAAVGPGVDADKALALARQVLETEAAAICALSSRLGKPFVDAVELILGCCGRVVVVGIGKSGRVGRKLAATLLHRHACILRARNGSDARRPWNDHAGRRRRGAVEFRRDRRGRRLAAPCQARRRAHHRAHRQQRRLARIRSRGLPRVASADHDNAKTRCRAPLGTRETASRVADCAASRRRAISDLCHDRSGIARAIRRTRRGFDGT